MDIDKDFAKVRESVELLAAQRGDDLRPLSAVRRQELRPLGTSKMRSKQIAAAPTQADYNALQADVALIFNLLHRISNVQGTAIISAA